MRPLAWIAVVATTVTAAVPSGAEPTLRDYRYFRALSIDLVGRPPTRDEIRAFEQPGFDLDQWLDGRLAQPAYAERIRRIYMDLLRLELPAQIQYKPGLINLRATQILDPSGRKTWLYYRPAQRRANPDLDGQVCFTPDEIGVKVPNEGDQIGTLKPVAQAVFDARTVAVKPWWLYADYRASAPTDVLSPQWRERFGIEMSPQLFVEPGTKTPLTTIRVCREEAQTAAAGKVYASGRKHRQGDPIPPNRLTRPPADTAFAVANAGKSVSCLSASGLHNSLECGCGIGLERCLPLAPAGFMTVADAPLGSDQPFNKAARPAHLWMLSQLADEPVHFLDRLLLDDRDFRDVLVGRGTVVNGPLALFYRTLANAKCCDQAAPLGYVDPEPLFDPRAAPTTLAPVDVAHWEVVADRGPHAAGVMTMPVFLRKYGSGRQRAHAIYGAFLCQEFRAERAKLVASSEADLTKRPGCRACHVRLEPMAAYFARVDDQDWSYLPAKYFPTAQCGIAGSPACKQFYDPALGTLRYAHSSPAHADLGPAGFGQEVTSSDEFAPCVVHQVTRSLLGRPLTQADGAWKAALVKTFVDGGYRMRALVRAIVTSPAYRDLDDRR